MLTGLFPSRTMSPSARPVYYSVVFAWYVILFYAVSPYVAKLEKPIASTGRFCQFFGGQWRYLSFLIVVSMLVRISPS